MEYLITYWAEITLVLLIADKVVAATPTPWDDLILTSIKRALKQVTGK